MIDLEEAVSGSDDFPDDTASKAKSRRKNRDRSARDVSNEHKAILDVAYEHLRMLLITDKPWARGREMDRLIMQAWENACDELGLVGEQRLRPGLKERARVSVISLGSVRLPNMVDPSAVGRARAADSECRENISPAQSLREPLRLQDRQAEAKRR